VTGFGTALRLEWPLLRADRAFWALLALYSALLLVAAASGRALVDARVADAQRLVADTATVEQALARQAAQWDGEGKPPVAALPGPVSFSVLPAWAILPPASLTPLALGQADLLPDRYAVTARPAHTFLARPELASPAALTLGSLDVAFLLLFGLPIVVLAVAFNVVSREREAGALALAAAQGVDPAAFVLAKWTARLAVTAAIVAAALLAAAALAGRGRVAIAPLDLGVWLAVALGYAAFWFAICLWVNARGRSSDRNGVALVGAWVTLVVVVPALTALAVTTVFPPPSRVELTTVLRDASEAADKSAAAEREKYAFDHPELAGQEIDPDEFYRTVAATEAEITRSVAPALRAFDVQADRQQRLVDALQYLSPAMLAHQALLAAAGTDARRYAEFRAQVVEFHRLWRGFFVERLERRERLSADDYASAPRFTYRSPPASARAGRLVVPLVALYGVTVVIVWLAWRRLRRQPVT
jgi:ABC-2 type transport system permease protein